MSKIKHTAVTKKIVLQSLLAMLVWAVFVLFVMLAGWFICSAVSWNYDSVIYKLLDFIRCNDDMFIWTAVFFGWIFVFVFAVNRALNYLDTVTAAAEKLAAPTAEQIILPDELKNVQDELNEVRENALKAAALAKEAEQRKNDLVVYLAHDLKTPLTSVIGYLSLLDEEQELPAEAREKYTRIALEKSQRLEQLINEFFDITRFNLSDISLEYSSVSLNIMLEQLVSEFMPALEAENLSCDLQLAGSIPIYCDADKMSRVFDNLLRNAVSYSDEGSVISITAYRRENKTLIEFQNHGRTIPPDKLERIFEQFFRLDSSRGTNKGGAGLGLAIARRIVTLHGGEISARSENGRTSFTVMLPVQNEY